MGRGGRQHTTSSARRGEQYRWRNYGHPDIAEKLAEIQQRLHSEKGFMLVTALIAMEFEKERPAHERPTGLEQIDDRRSFRRTSPLIQSVRNDPRFAEDLQVMVDIDSTIFSMTEALQEMGVRISVHELEVWDGGHNPMADAIMRDYWKRPDLLGELQAEQQAEYNELLGEFFRRMHTNEELMKKSGTFQFAPLALQLLHRQGVRIHLFTHRNPASRRATEAWLDAMGIPYDSLRVEDPASERADKIDFCKREGIGFCVDDKPQTIREAEAAGIEAFSIHWPYTRETIAEHDADEGECWHEIYSELLDAIEARIKTKAAENN